MKKTPTTNQLKEEITFFEGHPERWTQGVLAFDENFNEVDPSDRRAKCFCQLGNRQGTYGSPNVWEGDCSDAALLVDAVAQSMGYSSAVKLNDATDFETVMEMLYVALEHAKGAGV